MASNQPILTITTQGIQALINIIATDTPFFVKALELSENITQPVNPNIWDPTGGGTSGYYRIDSPQDVNAMVKLSKGLGNVFVVDIRLDETEPYNQPYTISAGQGWVVDPIPIHSLDFINIGSFCILITDPITTLDVAFVTGFFPELKVQKYNNSSSIPGNIVEIFENIPISPNLTDTITYIVEQFPQAQMVFQNDLNLLPVPTIDTPNAYILNDCKSIAFTDYKLWFFTNYFKFGQGYNVTSIIGNTIQAPTLVASLPPQVLNVSLTTEIIAEIYDNTGLNIKSFYINFVNTTTGNITISQALSNTLVGDDLIVFFSDTNIPISALQVITVVPIGAILLPDATLTQEITIKFLLTAPQNTPITFQPSVGGQTIDNQTSVTFNGVVTNSYTFSSYNGNWIII